jgi:hypothetical protein
MRRTARRMKRAAMTPAQQRGNASAAQRRGKADRQRRHDALMAPVQTFGRRTVLIAVAAVVVFLAVGVGNRCLTGSNSPIIYYAPPASASTATVTPTAWRTPTPRAVLATATPRGATPTPRRAVLGENGTPYTVGATPTALPFGADTYAAAYVPPRIGGDTVPSGVVCAEDEVLAYARGADGLGCVHYEVLAVDFVLECLIGNSTHGTNNASAHARDAAYASWCSTVIDDASDGVVSLSDVLTDTAQP